VRHGDLLHIGLGDVVALDAAQHLLVDADLGVSPVLLAAGVNAKPSELPQGESEAQGSKHGSAENEDHSLEESRHRHLSGREAAPL